VDTDDANVFFQLAQWGLEIELQDASGFLWGDELEEDFEFSERSCNYDHQTS
jgi:hypothetical protein